MDELGHSVSVSWSKTQTGLQNSLSFTMMMISLWFFVLFCYAVRLCLYILC